MPALGIVGVTTPAEWLTKGGVGRLLYSRRRFVSVSSSLCACEPPPDVRVIPGAPGSTGVEVWLFKGIMVIHAKANKRRSR
jgi:hypothetical protein